MDIAKHINRWFSRSNKKLLILLDFSVAQNALTAATGVGTCNENLQIAIASTGIGLIIVAVGMLISYMSKLNPVVDKIEQAMCIWQ
jgi:hypothetical protein